MKCIFCKIINGDIPSYTIYEDDIVKVFLNIEPAAPGHSLIVPKKHFDNLEDIDMDTLSHINKISKEIYKLLKDKLNIDSMSVMQNNGSIQEVLHYHMHIRPYYNSDNSKSIEEVFDILKN